MALVWCSDILFLRDFDFEAAHRTIAEYESRTDSAEQRAPTRIWRIVCNPILTKYL
jgi:hypothetical protein